MANAADSQIFVLVHGAWHGGWCWRRVAQRLREAGHTVFAPTLTGLGERVHLLGRDLTIDRFATDVMNVLEAEELRDIVLVGHSFGGAPISVVADRRPELLRRLVYLDAVVLENGESPLGQLPPGLAAERVRSAEAFSNGLTMPPPSPAAFGVTDAVDVAWLQRRLTPHPFASYQEPIRLRHPLGNGVQKMYIACTRPVYPAFKRLHEWVRSRSDWHYVELACGHDAMVTCPDALAGLLARDPEKVSE